ncbi:S24 family peptidase [Ralstonia nicotianae]
MKDPTTTLEGWQIEDAVRLKALYNERKGKLSQEEFGSRYEIGSQGMVWQYLNARRPLNIKAAAAFARGLGVDVASFSPKLAAEMKALTSPLVLSTLNSPEAKARREQEELEAERLDWEAEESRQRASQSKGYPARPISIYNSLEELPPETTVLITHIDVALSAGNGRETWHIEERQPLPFQADYIRRLDATPKNLVAVKVRGDSMEPRLFDDDTVVVDKADQRIPAGGGVFALIYAGEMLVKRLFKMPDGSLRVVSDNKEKHDPFVVPTDQLEHIDIVGRVKYRSGMGDF